MKTDPINLKIAALVDKWLPAIETPEVSRIELNREIFQLLTDFSNQSKWIDVREQLPDCEGEYLVRIEDNMNDFGCYHEVGYFNKDGNWNFGVEYHNSYYVLRENITHWMTIPKQ